MRVLNLRANATTLANDLGMRLVLGEANRECYVAWLSRLPIRCTENHHLPVLAKTLLEIEVAWQGTPLSLFATHLGSWWDVHRPTEEIPAILDVLRLRTGRAHLLVGDLNALARAIRSVSRPRVCRKEGKRSIGPRVGPYGLFWKLGA